MASVTIPSVPAKVGAVTVQTVMVSYTVDVPADPENPVRGHLHIAGDRIPTAARDWLEAKLVAWLERMEAP